MRERNSPFQAERDKAVFKPRRDLVDQPRDEALKLATAKVPWSKYVPFPTGTELSIDASPFGKGAGAVDELSETKLAFSFFVDVPAIGRVKASVTVTYKEDGSSNTTDFHIQSTGQREKNLRTHIQSLQDERIVTLIGGVEIKTNAPVIKIITLKAVHIRPKQDRMELDPKIAELFPTPIVHVSKKSAAGKK